jgi:hypothetical protein
MGKWYKIIGYVMLLISCALWGLIAVIPFLGYSKKEIAGIIAVLIIAGEITFYLSIIILGKSILAKLKSLFMFWKKKEKMASFAKTSQTEKNLNSEDINAKQGK